MTKANNENVVIISNVVTILVSKTKVCYKHSKVHGYVNCNQMMKNISILLKTIAEVKVHR